ncbi:MAG: CDP-diacylglycerol--glycerol-3-phosphate 3-phosphatidyltransferase [Alphaproteobacteria bacterium]|nr:CDP-diacylglycerol--glycerol-3-phosphate 3-phosphatidyltransferase [Alphaproteobacteria bacterium]
MMFNLPNSLTLFRIAIIPPLVGLFYIQEAWAIWSALALYILAAISDYFDGYFARTMNQMSAFGRFLDPIADKLFVAATLVMLAGFNRIDGFWLVPAIAIMMREILIAGLREFLGPHKIILPVSKLAKWKTTSQMIAIGFLIVGPYGEVILPYTLEIGQWGLLIASILTLITGWDYMKTGIEVIRQMDTKP